MQSGFDEYTVRDLSDGEIVGELCKRLKALRRSCCFSQQELSERSGVSIASVKRIETGAAKDINILTIIRLLRAMGMLDGVAGLVPEVPESPFLEDGKTGLLRQRCRKSYRRLGNER
jgi:transcriptional regulator with XRE-family HTH domain